MRSDVATQAEQEVTRVLSHRTMLLYWEFVLVLTRLNDTNVEGLCCVLVLPAGRYGDPHTYISKSLYLAIYCCQVIDVGPLEIESGDNGTGGSRFLGIATNDTECWDSMSIGRRPGLRRFAFCQQQQHQLLSMEQF
ncbi:hypothetical protein CBL_07135 [Carabus blaptoides fortunei]